MKNFERDSADGFHRHTRLIYSAVRLLGSPLEGMFYLLAFILCKDLDASPLHITLLVASKPAVALLSFYVNLFIKNKTSNLKGMLILSTILGSLPCLLIPFINNLWFIICAHGIFMMSLRAMLPAWAEILKINLNPDSRSRVFSLGSMANYSSNIILPLLVAPWLDTYPGIWKWLYFGFASLNCANALFLMNLRLKPHDSEKDGHRIYQLNSVSSALLDPWRNGWQLIKQRADFRGYQIVFMFCGGGLMVMHPVLPIFFKETLNVTYVQLTLATSLCKGAGFVLSSSIWANWLTRIPIHLFNLFVCGFASIFSLLIIYSSDFLACLYIGYLMYGFMQAGSELSWNLSGPLFAQKKDSTLYTGVNVAAVGIRGCIAPFCGEMILLASGSALIVFGVGGLMCVVASCYSFWLYFVPRREHENVAEQI